MENNMLTGSRLNKNIIYALLISNFWLLSYFSPLVFVCIWLINKNDFIISFIIYSCYILLTMIVFSIESLYANWYFYPIYENSVESFLIPKSILIFLRIILILFTIGLYGITYRNYRNLILSSSVENDPQIILPEKKFSKKVLASITIFILLVIYYVSIFTVYTVGIKEVLRDEFGINIKFLDYFIYVHLFIHCIIAAFTVSKSYFNANIQYDEQRFANAENKIKEYKCMSVNLGSFDKISEITSHLLIHMILVWFTYMVIFNIAALVIYLFPIYCRDISIVYFCAVLLNYLINTFLYPCLSRYCSERVIICYDMFETCIMIKIPLVLQKRINVLLYHILISPYRSLDFTNDIEYCRMYYGEHASD